MTNHDDPREVMPSATETIAVGRMSLRFLIDRLMSDTDPEAKINAINALVRLKFPDAVAPLISALYDQAPAVRMTAIAALGEYGDPEAVEPLAAVYETADSSTRLRIIEALGRIADPSAMELLLKCLDSGSTSARIHAAEALGRIGNVKAVGALIRALTEADTLVRAPTAEALGQIGDSSAVGALVEHLEDRSWEVQWMVAQSLARIGARDSAGPLLAWCRKFLASEQSRLSLEEKVAVVHELNRDFLSRIDYDFLKILPSKVHQTVHVMAWVGSAQDGRWVDQEIGNPVLTIIEEQLEQRADEVRTVAGHEGAKPLQPAADASVAAPADPAGHASDPAPGGADEPDFGDSTMVINRDDETLHMPVPRGVVADLLRFLSHNSLSFLVMVGGALHDVVRGETPEEVDLTFQIRAGKPLLEKISDPVAWNLQFTSAAGRILRQLSQGLGCKIEALLKGTAVFKSDNGSVRVHFVGPYTLEEKETEYLDYEVRQVVRRRLSRRGLIADLSSRKVVGLVSGSVIDEAWMDTQGQWQGQYEDALIHIQAGEIHVAPLVPSYNILSILHVLYLKHARGFSLTDSALDFIEKAAEEIVRNPNAAAGSFSRSAFNRLLDHAALDRVVRDLDLLNLMELLSDVLDTETLTRVNAALSAAGTGSRSRSDAAHRPSRDLLKHELEAAEKFYKESQTEFAKLAHMLDTSRQSVCDLEARLSREIEKIKSADQEAQRAAARLDEATRRIRDVDAEETDAKLQVEIIQEHRRLVSEKRDHDVQLDHLRKEVNHLRDLVARKQAHSLEMQEKLEKAGEQVEQSLERLEATRRRIRESGGISQTDTKSSRRRDLLREAMSL